MTPVTKETMLFIPRPAYRVIGRSLGIKFKLDLEEQGALLLNAELADANGMNSHGLLGAYGALTSPHLGLANGAIVLGKRVQEIGKPTDKIRRFNANRAFGQLAAQQVLQLLAEDAFRTGSAKGVVTCATHYQYGGGHVIWACNLGKSGPLELPGKTGFIVKTTCTSGMAEAVFPNCTAPVLGTDPISSIIPTAFTGLLPFDVLGDFATTAMATGKVMMLKRKAIELATSGREAEAAVLLPPGSVVDASGNFTRDPRQYAFGVPMALHKGVFINLEIALQGLLIGNGPPLERGHFERGDNDKVERGVTWTFEVTRPDALSGDSFVACSQLESYAAGLRATIDVPGNEKLTLPGQIEHRSSCRARAANGLFFPTSERERLEKLIADIGLNSSVIETREVDPLF